MTAHAAGLLELLLVFGIVIVLAIVDLIALHRGRDHPREDRRDDPDR